MDSIWLGSRCDTAVEGNNIVIVTDYVIAWLYRRANISLTKVAVSLTVHRWPSTARTRTRWGTIQTESTCTDDSASKSVHVSIQHIMYNQWRIYRAMRLCGSKSSVRLSVRLWRWGMIFTQVGIPSKIISWPNSLRHLLTLIPTWAIWCDANTTQIGVGWGWGQEHTKPAVSPKRCKIWPRLLWRTRRKSHRAVLPAIARHLV